MLKMTITTAVVAALIPVGLAAQGIFGPLNSTYIAPQEAPAGIYRDQLLKRLKGIHAEGLAQQASDGGTLTEAHRAALQAKFDAAKASYIRRVGKRGRPNTNADGWPA